ncbi:transglutaminase-like domain-containing protein [Sulfoacidibacillus thermotolerans]|uniref:Transglutaminase-like domain-containing protein n=1 Tax=Sulfoacidibacillus thermotolerans TaxID=1765684 RepID=A0A2U3D0C7_SULT2|nr:transglutaminase-like domain-containing protein [Sulfoacidibacillus thermotolerans]PWI54704.1 hypothetical protein BM613_13630 [Sulfoacidibacillus thermotolerans]
MNVHRYRTLESKKRGRMYSGATVALSVLLSMSMADSAFAATSEQSVHVAARTDVATYASLRFLMGNSSKLTVVYLIAEPTRAAMHPIWIGLLANHDFTQVANQVVLTASGIQLLNHRLRTGETYRMRVYGIADGRLVGMASWQRIVTYTVPRVQTPPQKTQVYTGLQSGDGQAVPDLPLPNAATSDQQDFARADSSFYLFADTQDPLATSASSGAPLTALQPGQSLTLVAFNHRRDVVNRQTTWIVNSPYATIVRSTGTLVDQGDEKQVASATFVAKRPGIYTIQAVDQGRYSVPLVITVGLQELKSIPFAQPTASMGVLPLPSGLPSTAPVQAGAITYTPYPAQGMWIPVAGQAQGLTGSITVLLLTSGNEWSYRLPVAADGSFSGFVESPFTGAVSVVLVPHFLQTLTATQGTIPSADLNAQYSVTTSGTAPALTAEALLSSATMDNNLHPPYLRVADALIENSPSLTAAIEAINNYASELIVYNNAELQPGKYVWQDALTTYHTQSGVCENYAQLAASMLRLVGIPTQTVGGYANSTWTKPNPSDTNPSDAHEWIQSWNGSQWVIADPTWASGDQPVNNQITNEFFTQTTSFTQTHVATPDSTGTDFSAWTLPLRIANETTRR